MSNLRGGDVQGGSSITQQLIKNIIIDPEERYQRSYTRKAKEVIMAMEITRRYPKEQILEWYLNYNFYGNFAYGIEAASRVYFDKSASELTIPEAAMLATIPQYPALNPVNSPQDAYRRQQKALDALVTEAGYLSQDEANAAKKFYDDAVLADLYERRTDQRVRPRQRGDQQGRQRSRAGCAGDLRLARPGNGRRCQDLRWQPLDVPAQEGHRALRQHQRATLRALRAGRAAAALQHRR